MSHDAADRPQRDARRDAWLAEQGVKVIRVPAIDVIRRVDGVVDAIVRLAMELSETAPTTMLRMVPLPRETGEDGAR
jgi:very-short-patch-repair endonuclease